MGSTVHKDELRTRDQPRHQPGVGGFHEISCPRKKKDRRLYRMQMFFCHQRRVAEQGGELLAAENMRIDHVSKCMPFFLRMGSW